MLLNRVRELFPLSEEAINSLLSTLSPVALHRDAPMNCAATCAPCSPSADVEVVVPPCPGRVRMPLWHCPFGRSLSGSRLNGRLVGLPRRITRAECLTRQALRHINGNYVNSAPRRYLSVRAASAYLGRSPHALYHLVARGQIPFLRCGTRVFFDRSELDEWMGAGRQQPAERADGG